MKITKSGFDGAIATCAGLASAIVPTLLSDKVISGHTAEIIGSVVAAITGAYHGGSYVTNITSSTNESNQISHSSSEPNGSVLS